MTISKFYTRPETGSVIDLSAITEISPITYEEYSETKIIKTSFWRRLFGNEVKENIYKFIAEYNIGGVTYGIHRKVLTSNHEIIEEKKSVAREEIKKSHNELTHALIAYDLQCRES